MGYPDGLSALAFDLATGSLPLYPEDAAREAVMNDLAHAARKVREKLKEAYEIAIKAERAAEEEGHGGYMTWLILALEEAIAESHDAEPK